MDQKTLATLGLLTLILLAACTPGAITPPPNETMPEEAPAEVVPEASPEVEPTTPPAETLTEATQSPAAEPKTVNLVSGGPQLVEFFAFW